MDAVEDMLRLTGYAGKGAKEELFLQFAGIFAA